MNRKVIAGIMFFVAILVLLIANINGNSNRNLNPIKVDDLMNSQNKIDSNEEIKYDNSLIYGINETYLDQNFGITLNKVEYLDNLYKYNFDFENTADTNQELSLNIFGCEINGEYVSNKDEIVQINKGERKNIIIECVASKNSDVNVLYNGKLFDGREIKIRFKEK